MFAAKYITDEKILEIVGFHDEAHNAYAYGKRNGDWEAAERRAYDLIAILGDNLDQFLFFYECDNGTKGKKPDEFEWFKEIALR